MKGLSGFFTESTIETRRALRSNIEKRSLDVNEQFLESFGKVKLELDMLHETAVKMDFSINSVVVQLENAKIKNRKFLKVAKEVKDKSDFENFIASLQLTPEELSDLRATSKSDQPENAISDNFFTALQRVENIHQQAKELLQNTTHQTIAIEIMDSMALYQETAFERLYRWTLNALRSYNADAASESALAQKALGYLQKKPVLLQYCVDEYVTVRRAAVVRLFIDALTRGSSSGAQAIDRSAAEPVRYVGDILGYLHQALASEGDQIMGLLCRCNQEEIAARRTIVVAISSITEGLSRPAKSRIEHLLMSNGNTASSSKDTAKITFGPLALYHIKNLLMFYKITIAQQLVQEDSELVYTLNELVLLSQRMFLNSINFMISSRLGKTRNGELEYPPNDLEPNESFLELTSLMRDLFKAHLSSPVRDEAKEDLNEILSLALNPLIKSSRICAVNKKLGLVEAAVYQANCLQEIVNTLKVAGENTKELKEGLEKELKLQLEILVKEQTSQIMSFLSMGALLNAVLNSSSSNSTPLSTLAGCDSLSLQTIAKNLDAFLADPSSVHLDSLHLLTSKEQKDLIVSSAKECFVAKYDQIFSAINAPVNNYDEASLTFLHHSPENVKALLN